MKVLLKKDVQGLGKAGEVKDVADGHARNYLIPRGFAVLATAGTMKQVAAQQASAQKRAAEEEQAARDLKARLEAQPVVVQVKAGSQGRLYGSVTSQDVVEAIKAQLQVELDKKNLEVADRISQVGEYSATTRLHRNVTARLKLDVRATSES